MLISVVFCEVVAIYGVIMAIVFSTKLNPAVTPAELATHASHFTGHGIFWGGITVGICNLFSGVAIGINGSGTAIAAAANDTLYATQASDTRFPSCHIISTRLTNYCTLFPASYVLSSCRFSVPSSVFSVSSSASCLPTSFLNSAINKALCCVSSVFCIKKDEYFQRHYTVSNM